jgi:hypothetical protein
MDGRAGGAPGPGNTGPGFLLTDERRSTQIFLKVHVVGTALKMPMHGYVYITH